LRGKQLINDSPQSDAGFIQHVLCNFGVQLGTLSDDALVALVLENNGQLSRAELTRRVLLDCDE
jgi:hypothetical protein